MRRAVAAAVVASVCLAGTSCTDDSGAAPPSTTGSAAASDPPTTSGPTNGPPELPEAAKAKTTAGAKAFVTYYVDVLNYAWERLTPAPLASGLLDRLQTLQPHHQANQDHGAARWASRRRELDARQVISASGLQPKLNELPSHHSHIEW